jgi:plastocyanin
MNTRSAAILAVAVLSAAMSAAPAAADSDVGRQLTGQFCTNPNALPRPGACIALSYAGQTAQGYTNSPDRVLMVRPGVYWLTVNDNAPVHNFSLESPTGTDTDITGVTETPGAVTVKVNLTPGTWVLFCDPHRDMGMYVDIVAGGAAPAQGT